jgi:multiple sugar transport system ATP-binding protein
MAKVALEHVSKIYRGGVAAVHDVSLSVADGEFVSLVGPSGCGKSTTLNLTAGLDEPTHGVVRIDDKSVNGRSPRERDVAMVFQSYALYPHLDVRKNLAFPLETAKMPRAQVASRVAETAALLGLTDLLARKPAELSGGQRQRVALGRALVRRPKAFLFDEPLSNLDAGLRTQLRAELKKLHERLGGTFIYVTHDQAEAMTLSDRVVVMHEGKVQQVGAPRELYKLPRTMFVAQFFGAPRINLVRPELLGLSPPRSSLTLGVRAENLALFADEGRAQGVPGRVYLVEPMGAEAWVTVEVVTVEVAGQQLVARVPCDFDRPTGTRVWLRADPNALHWFEANGARWT